MFYEAEIPLKLLMFQETEIFYIPGDGNLNV